MHNNIIYTIQYKTYNGKYQTTTRSFENETHYNNWRRKMESFGHKIVGTFNEPKNSSRFKILRDDIQFQLDCFRDGKIRKKDFFQAMDEILHGKVEPPIVFDEPKEMRMAIGDAIEYIDLISNHGEKSEIAKDILTSLEKAYEKLDK